MEASEPKGEQTERVVLERVEVPAAQTAQEVIPAEEPEGVVAWVERGRAIGSRRQAIQAVVGDGPGTFRAPSVRAWKGVVERVRPEQPAMKVTERDE